VTVAKTEQFLSFRIDAILAISLWFDTAVNDGAVNFKFHSMWLWWQSVHHSLFW
jgi:hypothetical protein